MITIVTDRCLVLAGLISWLAQKWQRKCQKLATRGCDELAFAIAHCNEGPPLNTASPTGKRRGTFLPDRRGSAQASPSRTRTQSSTTSLFRHGTGVRCALGNHTHGSHGGGCHERSPERPSIVLLLDRVGYRDCDRGRDTAHLSGSASQGLRQRWLHAIARPSR